MSPVLPKSLNTSTPNVQLSDIFPYSGTAWRIVESQYLISTVKLVDTLDEQKSLEDLLEAAKPEIPAECQSLEYLLSTPFRYKPYKTGSRFRRSGNSLGVFYCSEEEETAIAETAFYRLLFFADSPSTPWPSNALTFTSFRVDLKTNNAVDLTKPPLVNFRNLWVDFVDYSYCQNFADEARKLDAEIIRYESVRDIRGGKGNLAVLRCAAFNRTISLDKHTWNVQVGAFGVQALCQFPSISRSYPPQTFAADGRISSMNWTRATV